MALEDIGVKAVIENLNGYLGGMDKMQGATEKTAKSHQALSEGIHKGALVAAAGITALVGGLGLAVKAAADAERVGAQLDAVLASTGGQAGVTKNAILGLSTELSRMTIFDDEAITSAQSLLLTFTGIGKDVFPVATEAILNLSTAMGTDLQSSTVLVGKALNDPIQGVSALRRVGVQLTDAQEKLIESMVKVGDIAGAQRVILGELSTQFGGAAKAAGSTFAGQLTILQNELGNVMEEIGARLLPVLTPLLMQFSQALPGAIDALLPFVDRLLAGFGQFFALIGTARATVQGFVDILGGAFSDNVTTASDAIFILSEKTGIAAGDIGGFINTIKETITDLGRDFADFKGLVSDVLLAFSDDVGASSLAMLRLGETFGVSGAQIADMVTIVRDTITVLGNLATAGLHLAQTVLPLFRDIVLFIATNAVPALFTKLGELVDFGASVVQFFSDNQLAVDALSALIVTLTSFAIANLVLALPGMITQLGLAAAAFYAQAAAAAAAAVATAAAALPFILLAAVIAAVVLAGITVIRNWELITFAAETMVALVGHLFDQLGTRVRGVLDDFVEIGQDIVDGLLAGIRSKWDGLVANVRSLLARLPEAVRQFLGIASPSRVFAAIGENMMAGMAKGIIDAAKLPMAALTSTMGVMSLGATPLLVGAAGGNVALPLGAGGGTPTSTATTYNVTANYTNPQEPQSLRADLESLVMLSGT